jgi:hypothetical protein
MRATLRSVTFGCALLGALALGPGSPTPAAAQPETVMFGLSGNQWSVLSQGIPPAEVNLLKLAMLRGVFDGLMFGRSPEMAQYVTNVPIDRVRQALDTFYADYRNRDVFLVWALQIVSMELRGAPREEIDARIRLFRSRANAARDLNNR